MTEIDKNEIIEAFKEFPEELRLGILNVVSEELLNNISRLNEKLENKDFEEIAKTAFQIRNNAYTVYASEVGKIGDKIFFQKDNLAREEIIHLTKDLIRRVKVVLEDIKEFMKIINESDIP